MKLLIITLAFLLLSENSQLKFTKTYWDLANNDTWGQFAQQTTDGGFIIAGSISKLGKDRDVYLMRTDERGDTLWTKTFGGAEYDAGNCVRLTKDGGFIIAGSTQPETYGSTVKGFLIKTNSFGDTIWTRVMGGNLSLQESSVVPTTDGGYITTGRANEGIIYLEKINANGDSLWARTFQGIGTNSVQQTHDGGYVIGGIVLNYPRDFYVIKTNSKGEIDWTKNYGRGYMEGGCFVQQTIDSGFIIAGTTYNANREADVYLVKTNVKGNIIWEKTYGGKTFDQGFSVQQTQDGGYIIVGVTGGMCEGKDIYLIKTNDSGDTLWTKVMAGSDEEYGYSVQQTYDGGYVVCGTAFGSNKIVDDRGTTHSRTSIILIKTDNAGNIINEAEQKSLIAFSLKVAPNPFHDFTIITIQNIPQGESNLSISVSDVNCNQMKIQQILNITRDRAEIRIERDHLSAGAYFFKLLNSQQIIGTGKLIVQ